VVSCLVGVGSGMEGRPVCRAGVRVFETKRQSALGHICASRVRPFCRPDPRTRARGRQRIFFYSRGPPGRDLSRDVWSAAWHTRPAPIFFAGPGLIFPRLARPRRGSGGAKKREREREREKSVVTLAGQLSSTDHHLVYFYPHASPGRHA